MIKNLSSLSVDELTSEYNQVQKSYQDMKFSHAVNPLESPHVLRIKRRYIARLLTELSSRS